MISKDIDHLVQQNKAVMLRFVDTSIKNIEKSYNMDKDEVLSHLESRREDACRSFVLSPPFVRTLDFAQRYTKSISWQAFDSALDMLTKTHAFIDLNKAKNNQIRLILLNQVIE